MVSCSGISLGDDREGLGTPVENILENGTISRNGSIQVNDRIISINGEDLRFAKSNQARYLSAVKFLYSQSSS